MKGEFEKNVSGICANFTKQYWFPNYSVIKVAVNGSMEKGLFVAAVKHMKTFVRTFLQEESYALCLDGQN